MKKSILDQIRTKSFLITGGTGFIGSNLVKFLLDSGAPLVRVLDNYSNSNLNSLSDYLDHPNIEILEGDIRSFETCERAVRDINLISHQAALGSVPRSIKFPISTNESNVSGFLNMLEAARNSSTRERFVYASSSSVYGNSTANKKVEGQESKVLSPYALSKFINEQYANLYSDLYGIQTVGLRYFNVFGPGQQADNPYAAVIPLFFKGILQNKELNIFGDGKQTRDFTFVSNVIIANCLTMFEELGRTSEIYNVACGQKTSILELIRKIEIVTSTKANIKFLPPRKGDVLHSSASIEKIRNDLGYIDVVHLLEGLNKSLDFYKNLSHL